MREGYLFLDEKRLVLAAHMLRELARYDTALAAFDLAYGEAVKNLEAAAARHGIEGLQVYPASPPLTGEIHTTTRSVLGVSLRDMRLEIETSGAKHAGNSSPEAERCRELFAGLIPRAMELAAMASNLERLREEYRLTQRRARAMEDVLLPEIDQNLAELDASLEELDREEAIRVRWVRT